jgi:hypothetical protein
MKTKKNFSWHPEREVNPGPTEYEAGVLTTRQLFSVITLVSVLVCSKPDE